MIVPTTEGVVGPAKLLGIDFDCKLIMRSAVHKSARKAAWKKARLRARCFYSAIDLVMLFKSQVLLFIGYRTAGIHVACTSVVVELDNVQTRFPRQLDLSEESAFMNFHLAHLSVRRDVAMLDVIHQAMLRQGHLQLWKSFRVDHSTHVRQPRHDKRHSRHVVEWLAGRSLDIMRRSALGMIHIYNLSPDELVMKPSVNEFQRGLTVLVKKRMVARDSRWNAVISSRHPCLQYWRSSGRCKRLFGGPSRVRNSMNLKSSLRANL